MTERAVDGGVVKEFADLAKLAPDTPVAPAHGIAAIALSMAMKYHDMGMVKDGALYQQYKLEGRNIRTIDLADVFDTAIKIETYLLGASKRITALLVDALEVVAAEEGAPKDETEPPEK